MNETTMVDLPAVADEAVETVEAPRLVEILDETSSNLFVRYYDGETWRTRNVSNNPRNRLLYIHDLYSIVSGRDEIVTLTSDPTIAVCGGDAGYTIWSDGTRIFVPRDLELRFLEAVHDVVDRDETAAIESLVHDVIDRYVRQDVMQALGDHDPFRTLEERGVLERTDQGWLIHGQLLVTWESNLRNRGVGSYIRLGGDIVRSDSENDAFELSGPSPDRQTIELDGEKIELGRREMRFISHVVWAVKTVRPRGSAVNGEK